METSLLIRISLLLLFCQAFTIVLKKLLQYPVTFPKDIPIVGIRKQFLSIARASLRQLTNGTATLLDGYRDHARHGRPYIVYDPSAQQELLLPSNLVKWFADQSDAKLSSYHLRQERHAVRYLHMGIEQRTRMQFIERVCGDRLARHLDEVQQPTYDELRRCIDDVFGTTDEGGGWKEVNIYRSIQDVVMQTMSRVFFGLPLSRDLRLVNAFRRYVLAMGLGTIFVGGLPRVLKSVVARLVRVPLWYYRRETLAVLVPVVERQMARGLEGKGNEVVEAYFIKRCAKISEKIFVGGLEKASSPEIIAEWIMSLGFAGSSSTVIQATNLLLDLSSCPPWDQIPSLLRSEATSLLPNDTAWANPTACKRLALADSAIRESLRYHRILIKGLTKEVVPQEGLQLPDGTQMPQGGWVGIPVLGIHRDERFYERVESYEPFRYVQIKECGEAETLKGSSARYEDALEAGRPTATYLGFGYGRHACPGRWFAVLMLKMIVAYVTMHYDIEATGPVPKMRVIGDATLPPMFATMRVRRRRREGRE